MQNFQSPLCAVPECGKKQLSRGYCSGHYQRLRLKGDIQAGRPVGARTGPFNPKWRGGQLTVQDGRVLLYRPDHPHPNHSGVYVFRYRLVMEEQLGRFLRADEIVHHINGDPTDDRPENLRVMTQGDHFRVHILERHAIRKALA